MSSALIFTGLKLQIQGLSYKFSRKNPLKYRRRLNLSAFYKSNHQRQYTTDRQLQHFYWRAGFGINLKELEQFKGANKKHVIDHLFDRSSKSQPLDYDLSRFTKIDPKKLSKKQRQELELLI